MQIKIHYLDTRRVHSYLLVVSGGVPSMHCVSQLIQRLASLCSISDRKITVNTYTLFVIVYHQIRSGQSKSYNRSVFVHVCSSPRLRLRSASILCCVFAVSMVHILYQCITSYCKTTVHYPLSTIHYPQQQKVDKASTCAAEYIIQLC